MDALRRKLAAGRREAFAELYDTLAERLYRFLVVRLRSRADADDVLQETFTRLARNRGHFERVENLMAYVFTVARNEAARFAARRSRRRDVETPLDVDAVFAIAPDDSRRRETAEMIAVGLTRLTDQQREVVELKTYGGLTFAEIAEVTNTPQGTVATRYRTALGRLRSFIREEES